MKKKKNMFHYFVFVLYVEVDNLEKGEIIVYSDQKLFGEW